MPFLPVRYINFAAVNQEYAEYKERKSQRKAWKMTANIVRQVPGRNRKRYWNSESTATGSSRSSTKSDESKLSKKISNRIHKSQGTPPQNVAKNRRKADDIDHQSRKP